MTVQQNRITDLQEANIVLIRGLNSAKEEAEVLRQELSNSMETKEDVNALLRDLETSRKDTVCSKRNVAELQVLVIKILSDLCIAEWGGIESLF